MSSIHSDITGQTYDIPPDMFGMAIRSCISRGNKRFKEKRWHFELIDRIKRQCLEEKCEIIDCVDSHDLATGFCGFRIQTLSGRISIIVNDCDMVELLTQMKEGEHRHFTNKPGEDNDYYNPWFEPDGPWMNEILRVKRIMDNPPLTASQKRKLRAKRAKKRVELNKHI